MAQKIFARFNSKKVTGFLLACLVVLSGASAWVISSKSSPMNASLITKVGSVDIITSAVTYTPGQTVSFQIKNVDTSAVFFNVGSISINNYVDEQVYKYPGSYSIGIQPGKTASLTWLQKDSGGQQVPWDNYRIIVSGINVRTRTAGGFNIYGNYGVTSDPTATDGALNGNTMMFGIGLAFKDYIKELGNGSYTTGTSLFLKNPASQTISESTWKRLLSKVAKPVFAGDVDSTTPCGNTDKTFTDKIQPNLRNTEGLGFSECIQDLTLTGAIKTTVYHEIKVFGFGRLGYGIDRWTAEFRVDGTYVKKYWLQVPVDGKPTCPKPTISTSTPAAIHGNNTGGEVIISSKKRIDRVAALSKTAVCTFDKTGSWPISNLPKDGNFSKEKCCGVPTVPIACTATPDSSSYQVSATSPNFSTSVSCKVGTGVSLSYAWTKSGVNAAAGSCTKGNNCNGSLVNASAPGAEGAAKVDVTSSDGQSWSKEWNIWASAAKQPPFVCNKVPDLTTVNIPTGNSTRLGVDCYKNGQPTTMLTFAWSGTNNNASTCTGNYCYLTVPATYGSAGAISATIRVVDPTSGYSNLYNWNLTLPTVISPTAPPVE